MLASPAYASLRALPLHRSVLLAAAAIGLIAVDALPEIPYVDRDTLEFSLSVALAGSAIAISIRDRMDRADVHRWGQRVALSMFTLAMSAAGAEMATRWLLRDVTTTGDNGGYFSRRWHRENRAPLNAAGFRGRPFAADKPAGVFRVAVVGDSFTYGNGIRAEDRFTEVMQARLPEHIEVLNFGRAGDNTPQHAEQVKALVPSIAPDFILLQWYVNDVEDDDWRQRPRMRPLIPVVAWHDWLRMHSALYSVATVRWGEMQVGLGMTMSYHAYIHGRFRDPETREVRADRDLLVGAIAHAQKHHVPMAMVLFPDTSGDLGDGYEFGYLHDRVLSICAEQRIRCLDLRKDFAAVKDRQKLWANRLDHHPSALANAIAANRILETFSTDWIKSE
jgi:hypothetical protein